MESFGPKHISLSGKWIQVKFKGQRALCLIIYDFYSYYNNCKVNTTIVHCLIPRKPGPGCVVQFPETRML